MFIALYGFYMFMYWLLLIHKGSPDFLFLTLKHLLVSSLPPLCLFNLKRGLTISSCSISKQILLNLLSRNCKKAGEYVRFRQVTYLSTPSVTIVLYLFIFRQDPIFFHLKQDYFIERFHLHRFHCKLQFIVKCAC